MAKSAFAAIIKNDLKTVATWYRDKKVIPTIEKTIVDFGCGILDGLKGSLSMMFTNSDRPTTPTNNGTIPVSYNSMYNNGTQVTNVSVKPTMRTDSFKLVELESEERANNVLRLLKEAVGKFGNVTVDAYYEFCGYANSEYSACNYGWTDLTNVAVFQTPSGRWSMTLPPAKALISNK